MLKLMGKKSRWSGWTSCHGAGCVSADSDRWVRLLLQQKLGDVLEGRQIGRTRDASFDGRLDIRVAGPGEPKLPDEAFERLRWGGLFACVDPNPKRIEKLIQGYDGHNGFVLEQGIDELWGGPLGMRIPGITPRAYFFVARKTHLVRPGQTTQRFTYDVTLQPQASLAEGYFVRKQVPTVEGLLQRLKHRHPDLDPQDAQKRARQLVEDVFPIFLTREAKALEALQRKLPEAYRSRVPRALRVATNQAGLVTRLDMNWIRHAKKPISQLTFARQAAELLEVLHRCGRIMHLDLRLDNMVIADQGVCFVDFGSAAQVGEDLASSAVLSGLFEEMMRTSQIQRVLGQMIESGQVTNEAIAAVHGKVDRSVDAFYLAVQINQVHRNPELERLVGYDPLGEVAGQLKKLTAAVLKPKNPQQAEFKTAADILRGIRRIESRMAG